MLRKQRVSTHPLRHILMVNFLGLSVNELLLNEEVPDTFGNGPWPCLNPAASHFLEHIIDHCIVTRDYSLGCPVGTFSCSCGFEYSRRGPDRHNEDMYKIGRIKAFGPEWNEALIDLDNQDISLREKARRLRVDPKTVINQLNRLNESKNIVDAFKEKQDGFILARQKYRAEWIRIREKHPQKSKTDLRHLLKGTFAWLYRNDRDWLYQNSPSPNCPKSCENNRVDWGVRDNELMTKVFDAAQKIKNKKGKIERITVALIGREIGNLSVLQKKLDKLPKTKEALNRVVETVEDFQIRRVKYVFKEFQNDDTPIPLWIIERNAGLRPGYSPLVKEAIENEVRFQ